VEFPSGKKTSSRKIQRRKLTENKLNDYGELMSILLIHIITGRFKTLVEKTKVIL
jgi:hypothetical protein